VGSQPERVEKAVREGGRTKNQEKEGEDFPLDAQKRRTGLLVEVDDLSSNELSLVGSKSAERKESVEG